MDVSKSMSADDIKPTRLDAAKNAARLFVEKQPGNVRIGIVSFSDFAAVVQTPTTDHAQILESINRLSPQRGTAIGSAILLAMNTIFESSGQAPKLTTEELFNSSNPQESIASQHNEDYSYAAIVLLSDGVSNTGPAPLASLIAATDNGVKIYTVGVGSQSGAIIKTEGMSLKVLLDEITLKEIATKTGGEYFNANSDLDLQQIYDKLGTDLVFKPQLTELTAFFTGFAILVLIVSAVLSMLWFNRVF
jgi:Ca-activated chloride channel homolog